MTESQGASINTSRLGVVAVLFGLLLLASQATELLKQAVIAPASTAELGFPADCRADELEEEQLTLRECQLMVSSVQITLASSPVWFRPLQISLSTFACFASIASIIVGASLVRKSESSLQIAVPVFALLLLLDAIGFISVLNTGPLLRAQYLWPQLLWFFIHLCLLAAIFNMAQQRKQV